MSQKPVFVFGLFVRFKDTEAQAKWLRTSRTVRAEDWHAIEGSCLSPWFEDGDAVMVDRERAPRDGDIALCAMKYRRTSGAIAGVGSIKICTAIKQLRVTADGERYLVATDGSVSADAHEVLGTVVAWHRRAWWRRPSPRRMRLEPRLDDRATSAA